METEELTYIDTLDFIEQCRNDHIYIYGIERFLIEDDRLVPDLGGILDASNVLDQGFEKTIQAARWYLSNYGEEVNERFCIVFDRELRGHLT